MYSSGATPQPCMCTAKFPQQFIASQSYTSLEWSETVRVKRTTRGLCADSDLIPTPWIGLMGAKKKSNILLHKLLQVSLSPLTSAFSKTLLPLELRQVLSCKSPAVFLHFPLQEKLGPLLSALVGASKRETPTLNLTESTA